MSHTLSLLKETIAGTQRHGFFSNELCMKARGSLTLAFLYTGTLVACGQSAPPSNDVEIPFLSERAAAERTETRQTCSSYQPTRQPFFGELHLHTEYSMDAANLDTRNTPRDAYRFAKGQKVGLPPFVNTTGTPQTESPKPIMGVSQHPYCLPPQRCEFTATRTVQLPPGRALDFAAITDHSEFFGETNICFFEGPSCSSDAECDVSRGQSCSRAGKCVPRGYDSINCILSRDAVTQLRMGIGAQQWGAYVSNENPQRFPFCKEGQTCLKQAHNIWEQIQAAAEEAYDRTARCSFTSFIAYEYTGQPGMGQCANTQAPCWANEDCTGGASCQTNTGGANNLHRNIIFRNEDVVDLPISYMEKPTGCGKGKACEHGGALASPEAMLQSLKQQCLENSAHPRCDVLSIPHNSNISGGAMFLLPETVREAKTRAAMEPLAELHQIKGNSECRYSAQYPGAWNTTDELCDFESLNFAKLAGPVITDPAQILPNSFVRNVLKEGLRYQQTHGLNPFKLGFVGATDDHNGTPSATEPEPYAKNGAHGDVGFAVSGQELNETLLVGLVSNPGGLTGIWAEENSRDALFQALKRRETFATSGTRPVVRFFGGFDLPENMCKVGDFAAQGYRQGVPMGGTLQQATRGAAPRFAVSAMMDPGWAGHPGTPLQRVQIIKGWVEPDGSTHEAVYEVAGNPNNHASVDLRTCALQGGGFADLCAVWTDPDFHRDQLTFYYARVIENPSCRWNQYFCNARQINCKQPPKPQQDNPPYTQFEYQQCCSGVVPSTVQQRAWTSPIWYVPRR
jgi:hypothetical protein